MRLCGLLVQTRFARVCSMLCITDFLVQNDVSAECIELVNLLGKCTETVAKILAQTPVVSVGTRNAFGDHQLSVDVLADSAIFSLLESSSVVGHAASEEEPVVRSCGAGEFVVCFDPLDGSSIVDCNWAVGSIFGVWPGTTPVGKCGRDQILCAVSVYGPRTTMFVGIAEKALAFEAIYHETIWKVIVPKIEISNVPITIFSPANLRATSELPGYAKLVDSWIKQKLTLRYTGGMVPDVCGILTKKNGIFCSPVSPSAPAKLRLVFECAPIALLVEIAGGFAFGGLEGPVLDSSIASMDDRTGFICGSPNAVLSVRDCIYQ